MSYDDCSKLLNVLHSLVDYGNSVIVIEHNLDIIKNADWIIELGPEAGDKGGYIICEGTPEYIASTNTATGKYLSKIPNLVPNKKSKGNLIKNIKTIAKKESINDFDFIPERPKNLKIKKRKYSLSRWRRRRAVRV